MVYDKLMEKKITDITEQKLIDLFNNENKRKNSIRYYGSSKITIEFEKRDYDIGKEIYMAVDLDALDINKFVKWILEIKEIENITLKIWPEK